MRLFTPSEVNHQDIDPHFLNTHSVHTKSHSNAASTPHATSTPHTTSNINSNSESNKTTEAHSETKSSDSAPFLENNDFFIPLLFLLLYLMEKEENK